VNTLSRTLCALAGASLLISAPLHASDYDVDDADSLDFESFHTDKKAAIKIWEGNETQKSTTQKVYKDEPAHSSTSKSTSAQVKTTTIDEPDDGHTGRFEIRERYTLGKSAHSPYSAFYVIESLHKQMAELCPKGWEIEREWSLPIEGDFYLHYQFKCLDN